MSAESQQGLPAYVAARHFDRRCNRIAVWEDALWRLTVSLAAEVPGFAYLEPKRHVPYVTDLDGAEAATFGAVLARCTRARARGDRR